MIKRITNKQKKDFDRYLMDYFSRYYWDNTRYRGYDFTANIDSVSNSELFDSRMVEIVIRIPANELIPLWAVAEG